MAVVMGTGLDSGKLNNVLNYRLTFGRVIVVQLENQ
jgi:hypothetical protein